MIRPTKNGMIFLGICGLLYLASLTSKSSLLLLLIGVVFGCFVLNSLTAPASLKQLSLVAPKSQSFAEGKRPTQPWMLQNNGQYDAGLIEATSHRNVLFKVPFAPAGQRISFMPKRGFQKRGVHRYDEIRLSAANPFGLIRADRSISMPGEVIVYPAVYPADSPRASGYEPMVGGKFKGQRGASTGSDFAGVRPYRPGDSWKQIHWKASSKGLGMMVKHFEEELAGRVAIFLDEGHFGSEQILDDAIRAAGSLMLAALDAGHHVEWVTLGHLTHDLLPPFLDGQDLLESLARLKKTESCLDAEHLDPALSLVSPKSAVSLVLTGYHSAINDWILSIQSRRGPVSVYLPESFQALLPPAEVSCFFYTADRIHPRA